MSTDSHTNPSSADPLAAKVDRLKIRVLESLQALNNIGQVVNQSIDLSETGRQIIENVIQVTQAYSGSILLFDPGTSLLEKVIQLNMPDDFDLPALSEHYLLTQVITHRQAAFVARLEDYQEKPEVLERLRSVQIEAFACLPLYTPEQMLGIFFVNYNRAHLFSRYEKQLLNIFANQAATAIVNAKVAERERAARLIFESQRDKYQALLENASDAIFLLLPESGKIVEVNLRAAEMYGYPADKLVGRTIGSLFALKDGKQIRQLLKSLTEGESATSIQSKDLTLQCRDGTRRIVNFSARLVEVGSTRLIIQIVHDMTERRAMEQQLVRMEQLRALGQLASGVAHDFNNVLTAVLGLSDLLLLDMTESSEQRRMIEIIRQSALDGAQMVQRIQFLGTKNQEEGYVSIDLGHLLRDVIDLTRPRWHNQASQRGIKVELEMEIEAGPPVWGNPAELREVFINLIFNALDAMPSGGKLNLKMSSNDEHICILVKDTGTGMTAETKQHLFEPFYTTKQKNGHGLGLSVSWSIINRHKGTIEVDSNPGTGTTFTIKLPIALVTEQPVIPFKNQGTAIAEERALQVLVVDDEENLISVLARILEALGHTVTPALSGQEALEILEANPKMFNVVFTDLSIPDMIGWDIARAIRKIRPDMAVVLVTGWGTDLDQEMIAENEIDLVVSKPYRVRDVQSALNTLIQRGRISDTQTD